MLASAGREHEAAAALARTSSGCLTASRPTLRCSSLPFRRTIGDIITVGRGVQLRVVAIDDFPHAELVEHDVRGIFTVEPV